MLLQRPVQWTPGLAPHHPSITVMQSLRRSQDGAFFAARTNVPGVTAVTNRAGTISALASTAPFTTDVGQAAEQLSRKLFLSQDATAESIAAVNSMNNVLMDMLPGHTNRCPPFSADLQYWCSKQQPSPETNPWQDQGFHVRNDIPWLIPFTHFAPFHAKGSSPQGQQSVMELLEEGLESLKELRERLDARIEAQTQLLHMFTHTEQCCREVFNRATVAHPPPLSHARSSTPPPHATAAAAAAREELSSPSAESASTTSASVPRPASPITEPQVSLIPTLAPGTWSNLITNHIPGSLLRSSLFWRTREGRSTP